MVLIAIAAPAVSSAGIIISVAPPILPVYTLPPCPAPGYLWTPGYWAYDPVNAYYWVPGVWVQPPAPGLLWTPGYWGFAGGAYGWHPGYWGPHIGFYGGVNYGFGYYGVGFVGGRWAGGVFEYNTAVLAVGVGFGHVYADRSVVVVGGPRYAFNGPGGIVRGPRAEERIAEHDRHVEFTRDQREHEHMASLDRSNRFSENHGRPMHAAYSRPGERPAERPAARPAARPGPAGRPGERGPAGGSRPEARPAEHPAARPGGGERGGHPAPAAHPAKGGGHPAPEHHEGRQ